MSSSRFCLPTCTVLFSVLVTCYHLLPVAKTLQVQGILGYQEGCPGYSGRCFFLQISSLIGIITKHTGVPEPTLPSTRIVKGLSFSWSCMITLSLFKVMFLTLSTWLLWTMLLSVSCNVRADRSHVKNPCPTILPVCG